MSEEIRVKGKLLKITNNGNFMMPPVDRGDEAEVELPVSWEDIKRTLQEDLPHTSFDYIAGIVMHLQMLLSPKAEKEDLMTGRCERCGSALILEKPLPLKEKIEELPMLFPGEEIVKSEEVAVIILLADRIQKLIRHCNGEGR